MINPGAIPEVRLAELESAQHHLREQADLDRRAMAARNRSTADRVKSVEEDVATILVEQARMQTVLEHVDTTVKGTANVQDSILAFVNQQRGAIWATRVLFGFVGLGALGAFARYIVTGHVGGP